MKTAISLPDPLFHEAEQFAQARGLSRSELYARALELYLQAHRQQGITEALNTLYSDEPSTLDPAFRAAQAAVLPKEDW
jgi:metal-responsive CopG/Arc/MetJ family transcriptional regulator